MLLWAKSMWKIDFLFCACPHHNLPAIKSKTTKTRTLKKIIKACFLQIFNAYSGCKSHLSNSQVSFPPALDRYLLTIGRHANIKEPPCKMPSFEELKRLQICTQCRTTIYGSKRRHTHPKLRDRSLPVPRGTTPTGGIGVRPSTCSSVILPKTQPTVPSPPPT